MPCCALNISCKPLSGHCVCVHLCVRLCLHMCVSYLEPMRWRPQGLAKWTWSSVSDYLLLSGSEPGRKKRKKRGIWFGGCLGWNVDVGMTLNGHYWVLNNTKNCNTITDSEQQAHEADLRTLRRTSWEEMIWVWAKVWGNNQKSCFALKKKNHPMSWPEWISKRWGESLQIFHSSTLVAGLPAPKFDEWQVNTLGV